MKLHPLGLAKRRLFKQVCASTAGTEAHLAGIKSYHKAAWECFQARKVEAPQQKTEYLFYTSQSGHRITPQRATRTTAKPAVDPRTTKAILALERDCEFCWHELNVAVDFWEDGTRAKIRCLDTLAKWRKDYDARWDVWMSRGKKKPSAKLRATKEFTDTHGQIHFVAGEEKYFASAKEAERYRQSCEAHIKAAAAEQWYHSETNQQLMNLCERAMDDPTLWDAFDQALKQVDAEDREDEHEGESDEGEN